MANLVKASADTFKILAGSEQNLFVLQRPRQASKVPSLNLPPTHVEWPASLRFFLTLGVPSSLGTNALT